MDVVLAGGLILECDEASAEFDCLGEVVVDEFVGKIEEVGCGELRLSHVSKTDFVSTEESVATEYLFCFGVPDDELTIGVVGRVELIEVAGFAGAASRHSKGYLSKSSYLAHNVGCCLIGDDIDLVVVLICVSQSEPLAEFADK